MSYWKHYERFFVSMMKAFYGDAASAENNWCYDWLPKLSEPLYDVLYAVNDMTKGKMTGAFCQASTSSRPSRTRRRCWMGYRSSSGW